VKDAKKWCSDSVERATIESELRALLMSDKKRDEPSVQSALTPAECQALKDLRDSIQREIDLFCTVIL